MAAALLSLSREALSDQWQVFCCMRRDPRLITAVCIFWVERVGGGLGAPVVPYFLLALGLSAPDIGLLSTVSLVCLILPAPLYGWIQDRHGPLYTIMVSSAACAIGCGLRGFAQNFWWLLPSAALAGFGGGNLVSTISAHVATETPPARRALFLSALAVQGAVLRTCGQALYVPWDAGLRLCGLAERLLRFRITLSVCTFFCMFGVVQLAFNGRHLAPAHLRRAAPRPGAAAETESDTSDTERRASSTEAEAELGERCEVGGRCELGGNSSAELVVLVKGRASPPSPTATKVSTAVLYANLYPKLYPNPYPNPNPNPTGEPRRAAARLPPAAAAVRPRPLPARLMRDHRHPAVAALPAAALRLR